MPATLTIVPWSDPVTDAMGHDPRSLYAETFWLPTLGPTSLLLLRHLANRLDASPDGVELRIADASLALGVGNRDGSTSPVVRTLARLEQFDLALTDPRKPTIAVRRTVPPLPERHVRRLAADLQDLHARWAQVRLTNPRHLEATSRAKRLALRLVKQGEDLDRVEMILGATGFHPAVSAAAARWVRDERGPASQDSVGQAGGAAASAP